MIEQRWVTKKPKFDKECIVICAHKFRREWEYSSYLIKRIDFDDKWYWGWCNIDGKEYDDIAEMKAKKYYVIPI